MSGLYVPPEGAVQFEVAGYPGEGIWVQPVSATFQINNHCGCAVGYPVLAWGDFECEPFPGDPRTGIPMVCHCMGRIIE